MRPQVDSWKSIKLRKGSESKSSQTENDFKNFEDNPIYNYESKEIDDLLSGLIPDTHPFDLMRLATETAINYFKRDKSLVPTFNLFLPNEKKFYNLSSPNTKPDQHYRYAFINFVAEEVIKNNIDFVISIAVIRIYDRLDSEVIVPSLENKKNAEDMIQVAYISSQNCKIIHIPFDKNLSEKVIFLKPSIIDFDFSHNSPLPYCFMFDPIIYALKKVARRMAKT